MHRLKLALIYGSTREGRFADTVMKWAADEIAKRNEWVVDIIDPVGLPTRLERSPGPAVRALECRIEAADAFIVVTPEYNHGYPAALKALIDSVYEGWAEKPVAFVSYGGISGGLRAVEQLRPVFAELNAVAIRDTVSFAHAGSKFGPDGMLVDQDGPSQGMARLLSSLKWWATTLHSGRAAAKLTVNAA